MKFEFPYLTKSKLSSVNVRSEKHGPELVPAIDLKIVVDSSNDILDKFHPDLKQALYFKAQVDDDQEELEGIEPVTSLPNLKFPRLDSPLKWDHAGAGYRLDIDFGLGGSSNLVMFGCEDSMESPFINQAELDADDSDEPVNPFPQTPEEALAVGVEAE